ncbi:MAG: hypothetical protein ABI472_03320 [Ginsengibacter sp.]
MEKLRSCSLAMHKSYEPGEVISLVFEKLRELHVTMDSACIMAFNEGDKRHTTWAANPDLFSVSCVYVPFFEHPIHAPIYHARQQGQKFVNETWSFEEKNSFWKWAFNHTSYKYMPEDVKKAVFNFKGWGFTGPVLKNSATLLVSYSEKIYSELEKEIVKRCGKVFEQAYIRFRDLQKAEAQSREATRQASLDRVRGQIASMRSTENLNRIAPLLWHELTALGLPFIRCGVFIISEKEAVTHVYLSSPDGHSLAVLNLPFNSNELTTNAVVAWRKRRVFHQHWHKEEFVAWTQSMMEQGQIQNQQT